MNSESKNMLPKKIILSMVYVALLYLTILSGAFMPLHLVNAITLTMPVLATVLLFCLRSKESTGRKYTGFLVLVAFFLDIMIIVFVAFLFGAISIFLPSVFYDILFVLLPALILGANVFFTSPGHTLMKLYNPYYQLPVLLHNFLFGLCTIGAVKFNFLPLLILSGIFLGIIANKLQKTLPRPAWNPRGPVRGSAGIF